MPKCPPKPQPETNFDFEDCTRILNGGIKVIGIYKSIKDENSRVPAILISSWFLLQAKSGLLSLLENDLLSPSEIIALKEIEKRILIIRDEDILTISPEKFEKAIALIRLCATSKKLSPKIWSKFDSQFDLQTLFSEVDHNTDFDFSLFFPRQKRNIAQAIRKTTLNCLYQASDVSEKSVESQLPESFCNNRDLKKAKLILKAANDFVEEIIDGDNVNALIDEFKQELLESLN